MLKIKDNVDLKELKKYGYKNKGNYNRGDYWAKEISELKEIGGISVNFERNISFQFPYMHIEYPDIEDYIQDLIKTDLVEKVDDNK